MVTNLTKHNSAVIGQNKRGAGWRYEEPDLYYEMADLYYESFGPLNLPTNLAKNSASVTNLIKT